MAHDQEANSGPAGVKLDVLEPIFDGMPPLRYDVNLIRSVVWATDEIKAARIIRVSPLRVERSETGVLEPVEMVRPLTYNTSTAFSHRLGGLIVLSATWIAGPDESAAHYLQRRDYFQYFNPVDSESLTRPEDILEAYDNNLRPRHLGYTALIGGKDSFSPNIFSIDGMKVLAATAPRV